MTPADPRRNAQDQLRHNLQDYHACDAPVMQMWCRRHADGCKSDDVLMRRKDVMLQVLRLPVEQETSDHPAKTPLQDRRLIMARPRKADHEKRERWDKLYATAAERSEIMAAAKDAGLSVSQYLITGHRKTVIRPKHADAQMLQALAIAHAQLETLVRVLSEWATPMDALMLQAHLMAIERGFRRAALPWAASLALENAGAPL